MATPEPQTPSAGAKIAVAVVVGLVLIGFSLFFIVGRTQGLATNANEGFLGTRATTFADINLIAEIVLLIGLTVGAFLAHRGNISAHQYNQTAWVLLNIVLVMFIMIVSFSVQVVRGIPERLLRAYYAVSTLHSVLGGITVLCGIYLVLRMNRLIPKALRIRGWKNLMRVTISLYWVVGLLGIGTYYVWYVQPREVSGAPEAEATPEAGGTVVVPLANYAFNPGTLLIPVGTTVIFRNEDPDPHTVTSDTGVFAEGILEEQQQEYTVTFDNVGAFPYFCLYHGAAGGVGMAGVINVGEAAAVAVLPTAVAPPPPTPLPAPAAPPAAPLGPQAVGFGTFLDSAARSDAFDLAASGLPTSISGELHAWLTGADPARDLGRITPDASGNVVLNYVDPNGENLLATYSGFLVTIEAAGTSPISPSNQVVIESSIPAGALPSARQLLVASSDAPEGQSYAFGLIDQSEEVFQHAKAVNGAALVGDFDSMNRHIEHMLTTLEGASGEHYKDFDGDGVLQDPGDGFGILKYADAVTAQAEAAAAAPDATENVKVHAAHLVILAENMRGRARQIIDQVIKAHQGTTAADQQTYASQALQLSRQMLDGLDANGNGAIEALPGEGGAVTTYFHSQYLATMGALRQEVPGVEMPTLAPTAPPTPTSAPTPTSTTAPQPTAGPTAAPVFITYRNIEIVPAQTTVKVGTRVTFLIQGSLHQPYNFTLPNTFEAPSNLGDGTSYAFTFNEAGTTTILCGYHPAMRATVVVTP